MSTLVERRAALERLLQDPGIPAGARRMWGEFLRGRGRAATALDMDRAITKLEAARTGPAPERTGQRDGP